MSPRMTQDIWDNLEHFSAGERSPDGSLAFPKPEEMSKKLMLSLDKARSRSGVSFKITSSYREGDPRSHGKGLGVDIACTKSRPRWAIIDGLIGAGFNRIGIYDLHIHADIDPGAAKNVIWLGESK